MRPILTLAALAAAFVTRPTPAEAAGPFAFRDGDRVVLVGNTLIEREQIYGYWEAALTARQPDRSITFRNLGWSGDTVFGEARASFDPPAVGFRRLRESVLALKPTVIILGYGGNEAFAGAAGLPRFRAGLNALLDALAPTQARFILLGPPDEEDLGRPLPDPAAHNRDLKLYRDAIREVAAKRGCTFVDLKEWIGPGTTEKLTDDGMHFTAYGYWRTADALARAFDLGTPFWRVRADASGSATAHVGATVTDVVTSPLRFQSSGKKLPEPASKDVPLSLPYECWSLSVKGLPAGRYTLQVDNSNVATDTAEEWANGVYMTRGPDFDQAEKLRATIVEKNRQFFHRWRPQNETYLFGFRKHEQGQNAREVPQFEPIVEQLDREIAKLRVPVPHQYRLVKE
jgi:lysophospholipase L1-like esterase